MLEFKGQLAIEHVILFAEIYVWSLLKYPLSFTEHLTLIIMMVEQ